MRQTTFDFSVAHTRASDPIQSFIAGETVNITKAENYALQSIRANQGRTCKELEQIERLIYGSDYREGAVRKRLAQMERKGLITRVLDKEINEFRIWSVK